jgi:hypothetical protein
MNNFACIICFETYNDTSRKPMLLDACGHTLCLECTNKLTFKECPSCRKGFINKIVNYGVIEAQGSNTMLSLNRINIGFGIVEQLLKNSESEIAKVGKINEKNVANLKIELDDYVEKQINQLKESKKKMLKEFETFESNQQNECKEMALLIQKEVKNIQEAKKKVSSINDTANACIVNETLQIEANRELKRLKSVNAELTKQTSNFPYYELRDGKVKFFAQL